MATFNLSIPYPDGEQTRILNAIKAAAASNGNPSPSNAQAIEWFRSQVVSNLKAIVRAHEENTARAAIVDIGAT